MDSSQEKPESLQPQNGEAGEQTEEVQSFDTHQEGQGEPVRQSGRPRRSPVLIAFVVLTIATVLWYFTGEQHARYSAVRSNALSPGDLPPEFRMVNNTRYGTNDFVIILDEDWTTTTTGPADGILKTSETDSPRFDGTVVSITIRRCYCPKESDTKLMLENRFTLIPKERWKPGLYDGNSLGEECYSLPVSETKGRGIRRIVYRKKTSLADITLTYQATGNNDLASYGGPEAFIDRIARTVIKKL